MYSSNLFLLVKPQPQSFKSTKRKGTRASKSIFVLGSRTDRSISKMARCGKYLKNVYLLLHGLDWIVILSHLTSFFLSSEFASAVDLCARELRLVGDKLYWKHRLFELLIKNYKAVTKIK